MDAASYRRSFSDALLAAGNAEEVIGITEYALGRKRYADLLGDDGSPRCVVWPRSDGYNCHRRTRTSADQVSGTST